MQTGSDDVPPWGAFELRGLSAVWLRLLHKLPSGGGWRRVALWLRRPLKMRLPAIVDVSVWGLKLRLRSRGNLSEQRLILMPQYLDRRERDTLAAELAGGGVFFDIGANAGVYSLWMASRRIPQLRVEAFEPDPELCAALTNNIQTNGLSSVRLHRFALGRVEGTGFLVAGFGNKGENRVVSAGGAGYSTGTPVLMTTLPAFISAHGIRRIDALKIDVEGFEVDVLTPLFEKCPREVWPPVMICETTHDPEGRLNALLREHSYSLQERGQFNGIYRRERL